jgi:hypothetical protein
VSSILRALKKLEEDAASGEQDSGTKKIKMKRGVSRGTWAAPGIYRLLTIVLAVLLVGAVVWIIINSSKKSPVTKPREHAIEKPGPTVLPKQSPALKKGSQLAANAVLPATERTAEPGADSVEASIQPDAGRGLTAKKDSQKQLAEQKKHPELILNGILWSDNPGRRVALINDQYLKEGDVFNGVTIVKIERKAVTLQAGEEKWIIIVKK